MKTKDEFLKRALKSDFNFTLRILYKKMHISLERIFFRLLQEFFGLFTGSYNILIKKI